MNNQINSPIRTIARRFGIRDRNDLVNIPKHHIRKTILTRIFRNFRSEELGEKLYEFGFQKGRTVVVHCSWDQFYNFQGDPIGLIEKMLELLGPEGTLVMPAYPMGNDPKKIFDVRRTPTRAGLLAEVFRRYPGVFRSINLAQSVCAIGSAAEYLTQDHHKSFTSWDHYSPYYRLRHLDSFVVGLGINPNRIGFGTAIHCAESILRNEVYYFRCVFGDPVTYSYRDWNGQISEHTYLPRVANFTPNKINKYLNSERIRVGRISNLRLQSIEAPYLIDRLIDLGRKGITIYNDPAPTPDLFRPVSDEERFEETNGQSTHPGNSS